MGDRDRSPRRGKKGATRWSDGYDPNVSEGPGSKRIIVSNIPYDMRWRDVKILFKKEVEGMVYFEMFNDEYGEPKGAGAMEFETPLQAKNAVKKMNKYQLKGRNIVVREDCDGGGDRDMWGRSEGQLGDPGMVNNSGNQGNTYGLTPEFLHSLNISGPIHNKIFVSSLDYDVDEKKLREIFRLAGKVVAVELARSKELKSRGFAHVVFDHPVEAVQAVSLFHDQPLFGRKLSVKLDKVEKIEELPIDLNWLPEGLISIGTGLGQGGMPLFNVRENIGGASETGNPGPGGEMGGGMPVCGVAQGTLPGHAINTSFVGQEEAVQAALTTLLAVGGARANAGSSMGVQGVGTAASSGMAGNMRSGGRVSLLDIPFTCPEGVGMGGAGMPGGGGGIGSKYGFGGHQGGPNSTWSGRGAGTRGNGERQFN